MALLNFKKSVPAEAIVSPEVEGFLNGYSIEVMPRTAEKITKLSRPAADRVPGCISPTSRAHRLRIWWRRQSASHAEGYAVMPHFPARIIKDKDALGDWIARYQGEANVTQALILAGGVTKPHGEL